jgi:DnaJ-class molecular chaperone
MPKVTCPCCHGTCWIVAYDAEKMEIASREPCAHCEGTGEIDAEVEEDGSLE